MNELHDERYEEFYEHLINDPDVIKYIANVARPDLQDQASEEGIDITDVTGWQDAFDDYCEAEYYDIYRGR
jgi:hypothetical protein|tara:strand:- start:713 stop:925 length:213 start_codon:yes stop_codon:yes gene_type:complete